MVPIFFVSILFFLLICIFELRSKIGCISEIQRKTSFPLVFHSICTIFAVMNQVKRGLVWLSRIHRCRGFGIQSPTDYSFVRYVINEHWPYYAYDQFGDDDWLRNKLGRLYFRLANFVQPAVMLADEYTQYWQAGCKRTKFQSIINKVELARVDIDDADALEALIEKCDKHSVLVVEGIWRNWDYWHRIEQDASPKSMSWTPYARHDKRADIHARQTFKKLLFLCDLLVSQLGHESPPIRFNHKDCLLFNTNPSGLFKSRPFCLC